MNLDASKSKIFVFRLGRLMDNIIGYLLCFGVFIDFEYYSGIREDSQNSGSAAGSLQYLRNNRSGRNRNQSSNARRGSFVGSQIERSSLGESRVGSNSQNSDARR